MCASRVNALSFEVCGHGRRWPGIRSGQRASVGHRQRVNEVVIRDRTLLLSEAPAYAGYLRGNAEGFHDSLKQLRRDIRNDVAAGDLAIPPPLPAFAHTLRSIQLAETVRCSALESR
jgi:hypothetical protein